MKSGSVVHSHLCGKIRIFRPDLLRMESGARSNPNPDQAEDIDPARYEDVTSMSLEASITFFLTSRSFSLCSLAERVVGRDTGRTYSLGAGIHNGGRHACVGGKNYALFEDFAPFTALIALS